jgi:hypothetical protein
MSILRTECASRKGYPAFQQNLPLGLPEGQQLVGETNTAPISIVRTTFSLTNCSNSGPISWRGPDTPEVRNHYAPKTMETADETI